MPDALEYAATGVDLDRGLGPVLHFGGYSYPPRYTIGYPLMLAAAYPLLGHRAERLYIVTVLMALVAIAGLYIFTLSVFDRPSAVLAGLLLAASPYFTGLSTFVMSDVPALAVVILSALAFLYAEEKESLAGSALCGLLAGLAFTIRPTNVALLAAMLGAALLVRQRRLQFARVAAFAIGLSALPGLQACLNLHYLGSIFSNGYVFWLSAWYGGSSLKPFELNYLVVPALTITGNVVAPTVPSLANYGQGNLVSYAIAILGIDGIFGRFNWGAQLAMLRPRYDFYPFPVAVFAGLGVFMAMRRKLNPFAMRAMYLGLGFLALLLLVYLFYAWTDPRFILPALFIVFAAAGYGIVSAHRRLKKGWPGFAVIALDVILAGGILISTVSVLTAEPPRLKLVDDVLAMRPQLKNAVVVSDISLQWLELIAPGERTEFVGLNNLLWVHRVMEEHLHLLYEKRSQGWSGPIPPILLPDGKLDLAEARKLADEDKKGRPVYLLLLIPTSYVWLNELNKEVAQIDGYFSLETVASDPEMALYRLKPR